MKVLIATLILVVSLAADEQPVMPDKWQNPAVWQKIKAGQTPTQVRQILGDPTATESTNSIEAWYYGNTPKTDENGKAVRPEHGCLMFRRTPTEHVLQKCVQPNWQILPTWDQLQTDYKQAVADQRAAEITERQRIADEAAEQRIADQQAAITAKQQATEQRQQRALIRQKSNPGASQQANTPTKPKFYQRSWLLDNIMIISIVLVLVTMGGVFVYKQ